MTRQEYENKLEEIQKLREERRKLTREQRVVSDKSNQITEEIKEKRTELKCGPFEFFKTDAYKELAEKRKEIEKEWTELNQKINPITEQIDKLYSECDEYVTNTEVKKYEEAIAASGLCEADYRRECILRDYETTKLPELGGYVFPDGSLIKMGEDGCRGEDHRFVMSYFKPGTIESTNQEQSMWSFIAEGNMRWMPEGPGITIDARHRMTKEQKSALYDLVDYAKTKYGEFYMDVVVGDNIKSFHYDKKQMSVGRIRKDFNDCRSEKALEVEI